MLWKLCLAFAALMLIGRPAHAQQRDSFLNGTLIGAAAGAGAGIAFTHATSLELSSTAAGELTELPLGHSMLTRLLPTSTIVRDRRTRWKFLTPGTSPKVSAHVELAA